MSHERSYLYGTRSIVYRAQPRIHRPYPRPGGALSLPLWAAMPPREAARIAIETAEALDRQLEGFPPALLAEIHTYNERWVVRALHRGEHLDEVDAALKLGASAIEH